jgi:hypothetical protein
MSANAIKNHIDGADLISPQMKSIIKSQKKLAPKEMVKFHEETYLESKRNNSNLLRTSSLSPYNKKVQIQKYNNKDRQYCSNVQYQQEIGSNEFIPNGKEDMEIIRKKLLDIKSSSFPGGT